MIGFKIIEDCLDFKDMVAEDFRVFTWSLIALNSNYVMVVLVLRLL